MSFVRLKISLLLATLGLLGGSLVAASTAYAEAVAQPTEDEIEIQMFVPKDGLEPGFDESLPANWVLLTGSGNEPYFFNQGVCTCGTRVRILLHNRSVTNYEGNGVLWAGTDCNAPTDDTRDSRCKILDEFEPNDFQTVGDLIFVIDASQLEMAVLNLAVNSRDAMPAGGRIVLTTGERHLEAAEGELKGALAGEPLRRGAVEHRV